MFIRVKFIYASRIHFSLAQIQRAAACAWLGSSWLLSGPASTISPLSLTSDIATQSLSLVDDCWNTRVWLSPELTASMKPTGLQLHLQTGSVNSFSHASFHYYYWCCAYFGFSGSLLQIRTAWSSPTVAIISVIIPTLLHHATSLTQSLWASPWAADARLNRPACSYVWVSGFSLQILTIRSIPAVTNLRFTKVICLFCCIFDSPLSAINRHGSFGGPQLIPVIPLSCACITVGFSGQAPNLD